MTSIHLNWWLLQQLSANDLIHLMINLYANEYTIILKNSCPKNKINVKKKLFTTVIIHIDQLKKIQKQSKTVFKTFLRQTTNSIFFLFLLLWFSQSKHTHFPPSASPPCHLSTINLSLVLYQWLDPAWGICSLFCCGWRKKTNARCGEWDKHACNWHEGAINTVQT